MAARYDRQLRIWGLHGQLRIENARICVLRSSASATETLKNLVLGGVGSYTIVDDAVVKDEDYGRNYFVDVAGYGKSRVEVTLRLLRELNETANGVALHEAAPEMVETKPEFFKDFTLVVATQMSVDQIQRLRNICFGYGIPLITIQSYGLLGLLRVFVEEVCVVESKPEDNVPDLRLSNPWPELLKFAQSFDLEQLTDVEHKHVPYVVILLKAGEKWRTASTMPVTSQEKSAYCSDIRALRRTEKKTNIEEENFEEAVRAAYQFWAPYSIRNPPPFSISPRLVCVRAAGEVKEILNDDCARSLSPSSKDFWIIVSALKQFVENHKVLPLNGSIPDMTATTAYTRAPAIEPGSRAKDDIEEMAELVAAKLKSLDRQSDEISLESIALFCKNARHLRLVRSDPAFLSKDPQLPSYLRDPETFRNTVFAMLLESVDAFERTQERTPGAQKGETWAEDAHFLVDACEQMTNLKSLGDGFFSKIHHMAVEICRFGGHEFHTVSAVVGGIAAQEAIKIITGQFVPFKGTLLYNAMSSTTTKL